MEFKWDVLLFDMDGVIFKPMRFRRYLKREYCLDDGVLDHFFTVSLIQCCENLSELKVEIATLIKKNHLPCSVEDLMSKWFLLDGDTYEATTDRFIEYAKSGIEVGVASSQERNRVRYIWDHCDFIYYSSHSFFSCDLGYAKPKNEFYQSINEILDKKKILFLDDSEQNVNAAKANGWDAILFNQEFDWKSIGL